MVTSQPKTLSPALYPGLFALSELLERLGTEQKIFPTSLTGDASSEIAEDDWERLSHMFNFT